MSNIKIAMIGCGAAAQAYYKEALIKYQNYIDQLYLVDLNRALAEDLAENYSTETIVLSDYKEVLGKVDGAIIALPHFLHFKVTIDFLNASAMVLCEKPLSINSDEINQIINTAKSQGKAVWVNNTRRLYSSYKNVKKMLDLMDMGPIKSITYFEAGAFGWQSQTEFYVNPQMTDKGILLDIGAHALDTICWWVGGKPDLISYVDDSFGGPESHCQIQLKINNYPIQVQINRLVDVDNIYVIEMEKGKIIGDIHNMNDFYLIDKTGRRKLIKSKIRVKTYPGLVHDLVWDFIKGIQNNTPPVISANHVHDSVSLIEECYNHRQRMSLPWYENLEAINV